MQRHVGYNSNEYVGYNGNEYVGYNSNEYVGYNGNECLQHPHAAHLLPLHGGQRLLPLKQHVLQRRLEPKRFYVPWL